MPQRGDIREGTIISVSPQEVVIDLGLKREGIVPGNDLSRLEKGTFEEIKEGTTWPVYILQPSDREGNLIVSLSRALQEKDWLVAQQMMDNNEMFEAEVSGHNAGGLEVIFGKLRGFVPASHISSLPRDMSPEDRRAHLATYMGKTIPVKVVEVDRKRRRLIMSERAARRRWQREHRKQLLDDIQVGEVRTGTVRSLSEFGAFVDLGGADGLVHISELAWFPVAHPSEVLKVGQEIEVKVLRIDKPRERVGLSLKRVQPDPWSHIEDLYTPNELVEAVVTRVTDFGAFVRLRSGVEGLLHVSEMADIRPDHPQSLVSPGDLLLLRVLRVEPDRRRIGLSLRHVSETEWAEWAASYRERQASAAELEPEVAEVDVAEAEAGGTNVEVVEDLAAETEAEGAAAEEAVAGEVEAKTEAVQDVVAEVKSDVAEAAETVADVVETKTEAAQDVVADVKSDVAEVTETVADVVEAKTEAVQDVVADVKSDAAEAAETVADVVEAKTEAVQDVVAEVKSDVAEAAETVVDEVKAKVEAIKDIFAGVKAKVAETVEELVNKAETEVEAGADAAEAEVEALPTADADAVDEDVKA